MDSFKKTKDILDKLLNKAYKHGIDLRAGKVSSVTKRLIDKSISKYEVIRFTVKLEMILGKKKYFLETLLVETRQLSSKRYDFLCGFTQYHINKEMVIGEEKPVYIKDYGFSKEPPESINLGEKLRHKAVFRKKIKSNELNTIQDIVREHYHKVFDYYRMPILEDIKTRVDCHDLSLRNFSLSPYEKVTRLKVRGALALYKDISFADAKDMFSSSLLPSIYKFKLEDFSDMDIECELDRQSCNEFVNPFIGGTLKQSGKDIDTFWEE